MYLSSFLCSIIVMMAAMADIAIIIFAIVSIVFFIFFICSFSMGAKSIAIIPMNINSIDAMATANKIFMFFNLQKCRGFPYA